MITALMPFATIIFYLIVVWVLGRMGDNVNRIRKALEEELRRRNHS